MIARLQRDVCGGAVRGVPFLFCIVNGHLFSVQAAEVVVPTLCDDRAVLDENAPHQRVGAYFAATALGHQKSMFHEHAIALGPVIAHTPPTRRLFKIACMRATSFCVRRPAIYSFCIDKYLK